MTAVAHPSDAAKPATASDLNAILARLKDAARTQGAPSYDARVASLEKLERGLLKRKTAFLDAIARDFGHRSKHETLVSDLFLVVSGIRHTKEHLRDWMDPEERSTSAVFLPASSRVVHQPLGVVGIISPWNYPVQLALSPLVGALAAGNRAMIKPSELVPETSALLHDLIADVFPPDQVVVVTGGPEVGESFSKLAFDHLVFTGSTRVGKMVMRAASENLVPVTLELGGKSPAIVGDYNVRIAAERIIAGKTFNAGQTCIAPDYVMIPTASRDPFVESSKAFVAKMYPTLEKNPDYTRIINDKHYGRIRGYIDDAKAHGAHVVEINPAAEALGAETRKIAPTLVLNANDEMTCLKEEIFGPVLPVMTYSKLDEAIAYVNAHPRPLALYYFGHDGAAIDRVLAETTSGGVTLNDTMLHVTQDDLPFGGVGPSGMGHYHGHEGFLAMSKSKPIFTQPRFNARGLLLPPYGKLADGMLTLLLGR